MESKTFKELLQEARVKKGFSKQELARAVGVHPISISKYEKEEFMPSARILKKIEKVLDIDILP